MKEETRKYRLIGITEILGSLPADNEIFTRFVASKAPDDELMEEEKDFITLNSQGATVFARNPRTDELILLDYQIKGMIKEAVNNMKADNGVAAGRKKVDNYIFISPRRIPIMRSGEKIYEEDEMLERPKRCNTMQGERVSLASSEMINDPWEIEIEITLIHNKGTKASGAVTWKTVEQALDYGFYKGIGQWRNGGYGRFKWEEVCT